MAIENRTQDYTSHKHKRTVYVDLNPKTKIGSDLIGQYHEQTKKHCMDIGRIGSHDEHGRYRIDNYTVRELLVVPKLIIRVTEKAMNRAGKDVYQLRTYMSKFGQLNFLLLVDQDKAELILVESVYISNLNHREDYETTLWILRYYNQRPIPLADIFYKFGIRANPDDYGKRWKEKVEINNILTSVAKAEMTLKLANTVASSINQKALVASLNYLNKEGDYGKKVTSAYSKKVATKKEINNLATSPKLENTLNHVLLKTLEEKTDKKDLKDTSNLRVYKKVLDIQLSTSSAVADYVEANNTKQNFKNFLIDVYQDDKKKEDKSIKEINEEHQKFEKIIDYKFSDKPNREKSEIREEKLDKTNIKGLVLPKEFKDFDNKIVEVDTNLQRFEKEESKQEKRERLKRQKEDLKLAKAEKAQKNKKQKGLRRVNALCDIDNEFEKSKAVIGLTPELNKKKSRKIKDIFESKERQKQQKSEKVKDIVDKKQKSREDILKKLEKKVKLQTSKKQKKLEKRQKVKDRKMKKVQEKIEKKQLKKEKQQLIKEYLTNKKEKKKKKVNTALMEKSKDSKKDKKKKSVQTMDRPIVKPKEENKQNTLKPQVKQEPTKKQEAVVKQEPLKKHEANEQKKHVEVLKHEAPQQKNDFNTQQNQENKKQIMEGITSRLQAEKENSKKQTAPEKPSAFESSLNKASAQNQKYFDISTNTVRTHKERTMDM